MFKNVFSFESERRKGLETLAETKARCHRSLEKGLCREDECAKCERRAMLDNCYGQLPDCDRLYVDNMAIGMEEAAYGRSPSWEVLEHREHLQRLESRSDAKSAVTLLAVWAVIGVALFALMCAVCGGTPW